MNPPPQNAFRLIAEHKGLTVEMSNACIVFPILQSGSLQQHRVSFVKSYFIYFVTISSYAGVGAAPFPYGLNSALCRPSGDV